MHFQAITLDPSARDRLMNWCNSDENRHTLEILGQWMPDILANMSADHLAKACSFDRFELLVDAIHKNQKLAFDSNLLHSVLRQFSYACEECHVRMGLAAISNILQINPAASEMISQQTNIAAKIMEIAHDGTGISACYAALVCGIMAIEGGIACDHDVIRGHLETWIKAEPNQKVRNCVLGILTRL
jgi:hypothetical protein